MIAHSNAEIRCDAQFECCSSSEFLSHAVNSHQYKLLKGLVQMVKEHRENMLTLKGGLSNHYHLVSKQFLGQGLGRNCRILALPNPLSLEINLFKPKQFLLHSIHRFKAWIRERKKQ